MYHRSWGTGLMVATMFCLLFMTGANTIAQSAQPKSVPPLPVTFDPLNSAHRDMFESIHGTPFTIQFAPDGLMAF